MTFLAEAIWAYIVTAVTAVAHTAASVVGTVPTFLWHHLDLPLTVALAAIVTGAALVVAWSRR